VVLRVEQKPEANPKRIHAKRLGELNSRPLYVNTLLKPLSRLRTDVAQSHMQAPTGFEEVSNACGDNCKAQVTVARIAIS